VDFNGEEKQVTRNIGSKDQYQVSAQWRSFFQSMRMGKSTLQFNRDRQVIAENKDREVRP